VDTHTTIDGLFANKEEVVRTIYERVLDTLRSIGPFHVEPKKTSIHLVHTVGFAGVHLRKSYVYLNLRTDKPITSPRVIKTEHVSKNRYHNEIKIVTPDDIDDELRSWLKDAYALSG
jgi:hypothetical protein